MPRNPAATRARIYAAAYALFYRKGFQRTSLDDIAAKAGVTKRTLYYHVRSKDDLAGAMLAHQHGFVLAEMARWMGAATSARKLVDQLFDSVALGARPPGGTGPAPASRAWRWSSPTCRAELALVHPTAQRGEPRRLWRAASPHAAPTRWRSGRALQMLLEGCHDPDAADGDRG